MHHIVTVDQLEHIFDDHHPEEGMAASQSKLVVADGGDEIDRRLARRAKSGQQFAGCLIGLGGDLAIVEGVDVESFRRALAAVQHITPVILELAFGGDLMRQQILDRPRHAVGVDHCLPLFRRQTLEYAQQLITFVAQAFLNQSVFVAHPLAFRSSVLKPPP